MKYIGESYQYLEDLGFQYEVSSYQKEINGYEYAKYIRVDTETKEVQFITDAYGGWEEEITNCVPIWAFTTIVKMINNGLID